MSQERVGIIVEVQGAEDALNKLNAISKVISRLNNQKIKIDLGDSQQIKGIVSATRATSNLGREMETANAKSRSLGDAMRTTFNRISSVTMHAGQQMQVMGKTLTQISTPFRTLMRSTVFAGGFKMLNSVTEGLSRGFTRYDTMKKYPKIMQAFGYSAEQAEASIKKMDLSVRGLPTGLDEMVDMSQRFTATTGDIEKGTNLAIAANNAFLASMSTDTQRYQGMMQLQDVLGGKDMNAREWNSLVSSMTPAIVKMGESMGYTNKNMDEWIQMVRDGKVANEDFIETLIKVGSKGGSVAEMAENSKDTWQAFFANVGNAASRMTEGIITALDEVSQQVAGKDLNRLFSETIIPGIDNLAKSIQGWIKANPDTIIDFFNTIKSFDFQGLFSGLGQGMLTTAKQYLAFFKLFTGKDARGFGVFMARAGFYGKMLNVMGGFLKGSRGIIATIGTLLSIPAIKKGTQSGGIFGMLGKALGTETLDARKLAKIKRATDALPTIGQSMRGVVAGLTGVMKIAGTIGIAAGTGFVAFKAFKSMIADLDEMSAMIKGMDWESASEALHAMGVFLASFAGLGVVLGGLPEVGGLIIGGEVLLGAITTIASGFLALDMKLLKSAFSSFKGVTESLVDALDNVSQLQSVNVNKDAVKGAVESLATVYELLKPKYQGQGIENMSAREAGRMKKVVTSMVNTIKSLADLKDAASELSGFEVFSEELSTNVQTAFKSIGTMFSGFTEAFGLGADTNTRNAAKIMGNVKKTFDNLIGENGVLNQIKQVAPAISEITSLTDQGSSLIEARSGMERLFNEIGNMFEGFAGKIGFNAEGNTSLASNVMENVKGMFDMLIGKNGIISQIKNLAPALKGIVNSTTLNGESPLQETQRYLDSVFTAIGNIYESITSEEGLGAYTKVTKGSSGTANEILENVQSMFGMFIGEGGIIAMIGELNKTLPTLVAGISTQGRGPTPMDNIKVMLQNMFASLNDIYTFIKEETSLGEADMTAFTESIGQLPAIMSSIQQAVTTLGSVNEAMPTLAGEDGSFPVVTQIKNMIEQLSQAFSPEAISVLQAQIEGFKLTITTLLQSISDIQGLSEGNPMEVAITINPTGDMGEAVISKLKEIKSNIDSAWNAIPDSLTKTITINISYDTSGVSSFPSLGIPSYPHTGGYISRHGLQYRAGGGSIFKKRGSDIVPAMLTPGEYVQNKKAVDFFGIDFMRKVNNLDYKGALANLLNKASAMAKGSASTTINNTYNNNQKVVINGADISNAGFTFKRASRFVGAI